MNELICLIECVATHDNYSVKDSLIGSLFRGDRERCVIVKRRINDRNETIVGPARAKSSLSVDLNVRMSTASRLVFADSVPCIRASRP